MAASTARSVVMPTARCGRGPAVSVGGGAMVGDRSWAKAGRASIRAAEASRIFFMAVLLLGLLDAALNLGEAGAGADFVLVAARCAGHREDPDHLRTRHDRHGALAGG